MSSKLSQFGARWVLAAALGILEVSNGAAIGRAQDAATGIIAGRVINASSGYVVPGARVAVVGSGESAVAGPSGTFAIEGLPAGTYRLEITKEGFQSAEVSEVDVRGGSVARVDVPLAAGEESVLQMERFTVSADVLQDSALGLLLSRQRSVAVSDAIAGDEISRLGLSDAAAAVAKMPGATILDGKYAVVRGLADRYTYTQLNGSSVPSADPDRRAVQLDQFPSELIDSVTTLKSFTPDQPGAFSGGSVNIKTKSFPEHFFAHVSVSTGYNTNATGEDILSVPGGGKDWQARDDGTRGLASVVPDPMPANLTTTAAQLAARQGDFGPAEQLDAISKGFHNASFFPRPRKAGPAFGMSAAAGDSLTLENGQVFGYVTSFTYDRATDHFADGISGRYSQGSVDPQNPRFVDLARVFTTNVDEYNFADLYRSNPDVPGGAPAFGVTRSSQNVAWGTYLQIAWQPTFDHELTTTLFHNQSAHDEVKRGVGEAVRSDSGGEFREVYDLLYTERGITSAQIAGRSNLAAWNDATLEWRAAVSRSTQDQPDYRTFQFKWSFVLQDWDPSGLTNNRYFRELEEDSVEFGLDFTRPFSFAGGRELILKLGGAHLEGDRRNRERAFLIQNMPRTREAMENFPHPVGITARTADSVSFGTVMREISANLNYDGEQTFAAGYAMADFRWSDRWRLIGGARLERTEILTTPRPASGVTPRLGEIRQTDPLPALAVVWSPGQRQNVRLSYGRTLARPTFRELADVTNYEAFTDEFIGGNPDLELTLIDNFDLRWEWFPRGGEVIAASLFYKRLDQPIEQVFGAGRIFPNNVEDGVAYGIELEARRRLDFLSPALAGVSVGVNAALIESQVAIPENELALIRAVFPDADDKRELFGQSPFIVNVDATYVVPAWGSTFTAAFGVFGERLALVTTGALPDVYDQPAPSLDFIWMQRLSSGWRLKFAANNLLDPEREKTLEHAGQAYYYERYTRGRTFSVSLSYSFN